MGLFKELQKLDELKRLEEDAFDAEECSVQAEKDLIDTQAWAVSRRREAIDARRAVTRFKLMNDL